MSKRKDPSPTMHDPVTQSPNDPLYRLALEEYFSLSPGTATEKLENFPKYVPRQALARFLTRYELFKLVLGVQGSVIECGVMFGGGLMSFAHFSVILEPYNFQRRIVGFDTFTGFPEPSSKDRSGLRSRRAGHLRKGGLAFRKGEKDIGDAIRLFDQNRTLNHIPKVEIVKGDFLVTGKKYLKAHPHLLVSCLYLDFDLYKPAKLALELFFPRIPKGGLIAFDQLNEEMYPGETIAALEVLKINRLRLKRLPIDPRICYAVVGD